MWMKNHNAFTSNFPYEENATIFMSSIFNSIALKISIV